MRTAHIAHFTGEAVGAGGMATVENEWRAEAVRPLALTPNVRSSVHRSLSLAAAPHWRGRTPALKPAGVGLPSLRGCRSTLSRWVSYCKGDSAMRTLIAVAALALASCANPYAQFYRGIPDARVTPNYEPVQAELQIYGTDDFDRDTLILIRKGYSPVGQSSFSAGSNSVSEAQLRDQATKIGAHVVLVASKYTHTVSGAVPLSVPQTTTSYSTGTATAYGSGRTVNANGSGTTTTYGSQTVMMPYSVARSDFGARYFVKTKSRLGVLPESVSDEARKRIQTNAGISVKVVTENTPAFAADVLPGDVILSIGGDSIQSVEHFYQLLDKYQGQKPSFKINRDGALIEKAIEIRSYELQAGK